MQSKKDHKSENGKRVAEGKRGERQEKIIKMQVYGKRIDAKEINLIVHCQSTLIVDKQSHTERP